MFPNQNHPFWGNPIVGNPHIPTTGQSTACASAVWGQAFMNTQVLHYTRQGWNPTSEARARFVVSKSMVCSFDPDLITLYSSLYLSSEVWHVADFTDPEGWRMKPSLYWGHSQCLTQNRTPNVSRFDANPEIKPGLLGRRAIPTSQCGAHPVPRYPWRRKGSAQHRASPPGAFTDDSDRDRGLMLKKMLRKKKHEKTWKN